jgi:hypothetical protein
MLLFERTGMTRRRAGAGVAIVTAALLLAACGSSDDDKYTSTTPGASQPPPAAYVDTFIAYVQSLIATTSDTSEPVAIDSVPVTAPENTEPVPVS